MPDLFANEDEWDGSIDEPTVAVAEPAEPEAVVEEPAAEAEPETEEDPEAAVDRDPDTGRFLPKKLEVDDPQVRALLDKYQGDPVKALKAAAEAQAHIGSLNNELGQLRPLRDQLDQIQARLDQPVTSSTQITAELIESNPAAATQLAYEQQNPVALQAAFEEWEEQQPARAAAWWANTKIEENNRQWQERVSQLEQRIDPLAARDENTAFAQVVSEITTADPGALDRIRDGAATLPQDVAGALYFALEHGAPEQKIGAFKALNDLTRGRDETPATLESVRDLAREQALEADRAIAEAGVVSATATKTVPAGKSAADLIGDEWAEQEKPYIDGWNF